jgi:hypothetical protein
MKFTIEFDGTTISGQIDSSLGDAADALICLGRDYPQWAAIFVTAGMALLGEAGGGKPTQQQVQALLKLREEVG